MVFHLQDVPDLPESLCHEVAHVEPVERFETKTDVVQHIKSIFYFAIAVTETTTRVDSGPLGQGVVENGSQIKQIGNFPLGQRQIQLQPKKKKKERKKKKKKTTGASYLRFIVQMF